MKLKLTVCSLLFLLVISHTVSAQSDSTKDNRYRKNIIRYNLSGALLFGPDKYIVLGYERVIRKNQTMSVNFGVASLPKLISISTESYDLKKDQKNSGFNFSLDYRFYLSEENKHRAPRGVYIGPYYSLNKFNRDNRWEYTDDASGNTFVDTKSTFTINTVGFQLGYQFIFWKKLALDLVLIGPGLGMYNYEAKFEGNVDQETKEELLDGLKQLLTQKFPGANFVFADRDINAKGVLRTNTIGYRYIIHIGFNF